MKKAKELIKLTRRGKVVFDNLDAYHQHFINERGEGYKRGYTVGYQEGRADEAKDQKLLREARAKRLIGASA